MATANTSAKDAGHVNVTEAIIAMEKVPNGGQGPPVVEGMTTG